MIALRALMLAAALAGIAMPTTLDPGSIRIAAPPVPATGKRIALSFDDLPRGPGALYTPEHRTKVLIYGLHVAGVTQAAFFVNPGRIGTGPDNIARVDAYVAAGHVIGDHSYSHRDLSSVSADFFLADIDKAEGWLKGRPGYRPWFRFPGLNQGGRDRAKRQTVLAGLKARGLLVAAVTADGSDWNIERLAADAVKSGETIDQDALQKLYVDTMVQAADFSDAVLKKATGRSPAQMLLLHETDLAARYIVPLVGALRADGWTIVTADQAYADPVYHQPNDSIASNGTLTEAIGYAKQVKGPLAYERTDPAVGNRLFAATVVRPAAVTPAPPPRAAM